MEFTTMRNMLMEHFAEMTKDVTHLFEVNVDKDEMWNLYLDSFPAGTNEIYRERRWHDCSCCRQFVKTIGNAVIIKDNKITTIWDFRTDDSTYQPVLDALSTFIKSHTVSDIYVSKFNKIGTLQNYEEMEDGHMHEWSHFFLELPDKFVDKSSRSEGDIKGGFRDTRNVFKRSLDEIDMDALDTILELITSNTLYKGEEWEGALTEFRKYKKEYDKLTTEEEKNNFAWEQSVNVGIAIGRIRNHSIGTLLTNVSEGMDLDTAVKKYEQIVAPSNYKRSKPIFTQKMLEDAQKKITNLGYLDSLPRRYARLDDITVNDILFSNKDSAKRIDGAADIFGELAKSAKGGNAKKFSKVEEVTIDIFINDILPTASEVELYLENKHSSNLVSLIAPQNKDSKSMFKWGNNFGWAYSGNLTDSDMKERVKAAGGSVTGDLRFSIQWGNSLLDNSDLDAHCIEPNKNEIYFNNCRKPNISKNGGQLDVDITRPMEQCHDHIAVENITFANRNKMESGVYKFFVNQYEARGTNDGFSAEIEFDGQIYFFEYPHSLRTNENVAVAEVTLDGNKEFSIKPCLNSSECNKEIWNLRTNSFIPVTVICMSPNHWNNTPLKIGHKHIFFMLKDCINDEKPSGLFNEFLINELYEHRKVMEALSMKMRVEDSDDQLSGIGFALDKKNDVIVKCDSRIYKVIF